MHRARKTHGYFDEVHWRTIRSARAQSRQFLVARDWVTDYFQVAIRGCPFKAFIADATARDFPYPGESGYPEHLLQSTKTALKAGIVWSFYRQTKVRLRIVFDDTDSELDKEIASKLPDFLQTDCNKARLSGKKRYPWLRVSPVRFVSSNPKEVGFADWPTSEFVQLCDVLLGASCQALDLTAPPAKRTGRRQLAQSIMGILGETLKVPWLQQVPVHRRFSVSLYPDQYNFAYPAALRLVPRSEDCRGALQAPLPLDFG